MERPADDIFKVLDLDALRSPLPKHLFTSRQTNTNTKNGAFEGGKQNWQQPPALGKLPPVPAFNSSPAQTAASPLAAQSPPVTVFKPKPIYAVPSSPPPLPSERSVSEHCVKESDNSSIILGGIQITPGRPSSSSIPPTPAVKSVEAPKVKITQSPKLKSTESPATASLSETLNTIKITESKKEDLSASPNVTAATSPLGGKIKQKRRILVQEEQEKPSSENPLSVVVEEKEAKQEVQKHDKQTEPEEKQSGDEQRMTTPKRRGRPPRKEKPIQIPSSSPENTNPVEEISAEAVYKNRIILLQWSLAVVPNSTKLTGIPLERLTRWIVLVGRRPDMFGEAWHSSIVTERITPGQICTGSGRSLYVLEGPMCTEDMHEHGFSEAFINKFQRGFPEDWRECLMNELDRLEQPSDTPKTTPSPAPAATPQISKRRPGRPPKKAPSSPAKTALDQKETKPLPMDQEKKPPEAVVLDQEKIKRGPGRPRKNSPKEPLTQQNIPKKRGRKPKVRLQVPSTSEPKKESPKKETSPITKVTKQSSSPTKRSPQQKSISPLVVRHSPRRSPTAREVNVAQIKAEAVKGVNTTTELVIKKKGPGRPAKNPKIVEDKGSEVIDVVTLEPTPENTPMNTTPATPNSSATVKKKRGRKPKKDKAYSNFNSTITSSVFKERTIRTRRESTASPVIVKRLWGGKIGGVL